MLPPKLKDRDLEKERCCLFSPRGELLWQSPAWSPNGELPPSARRLLGFYWHELVHDDDLPALLMWFADGVESCHTFRCMDPDTGIMALFIQHKIRYGANWLTIGDVYPLPMLPAPPCVADFSGQQET